MMKLVFSHLIALSVLVYCTNLFGETLYIAGDAVNVRQSPSMKGNVVAVLHFGETVEIVESTPSLEFIPGVGGSNWSKIRRGNVNGWVFGVFIARNVCSSPDAQVNVWQQIIQPQAGTHRRMTAFLKGKRQVSFDVGATEFSFSASCLYLAVDFGTDVIGGLEIFDVLAGKSVESVSYYRTLPKWDGECTTYPSVYYRGNVCSLWKEKRFCAGQSRETGKTGASSLHGGAGGPGPDPRCPSKLDEYKSK